MDYDSIEKYGEINGRNFVIEKTCTDISISDNLLYIPCFIVDDLYFFIEYIVIVYNHDSTSRFFAIDPCRIRHGCLVVHDGAFSSYVLDLNDLYELSEKEVFC